MRVFNDLFQYTDDISKGLNDVEDFKNKYKTFKSKTTKQVYNQQSIQGHMNMLSIVMREYPGFDIKREYKEFYDNLQNYLSTLTITNQADKLQDQSNESLISYDEIKRKVLENPDIDARMKLYMNIYEDYPTRDNFGKLLIKKRKITPDDKKTIESLNNGHNVIFITEDEVTLAFINYKTVSTFGHEYHQFKNPYKQMILDYVKANPKIQYLFGKGMKLSQSVRKMLITANVKSKNDKRSIGSINLLRKAFVSQELQKVQKAADREKIGNMLKHMPATSMKYNRSIYVKKYIESQDKFVDAEYGADST